jgi:hypothetical protein
MRRLSGGTGPVGSTVVVVLGLYAVALVARLLVAAQLPFPATEAAAYYAGVAQNFVTGHGLVSDAVWSYATPPLVAPKPAFELWMPLSSLVSAASMMVLGTSYWAAQVGAALLGALVAPLAWALARGAARAGGLEPRRAGAVALASGTLAALLAPFVINAAVPDSYTPFTVALLIAALLVPAAIGLPARPGEAPPSPSRWAGLALGLSLGLAYLARQEVIWLGLVVLLLLVGRARSGAPGTRLGASVVRLWPIIVGGLLVVIPWLVRNAAELGSPFPGQTIENLFLRSNEDIFAFSERPSAAAYLGQGLGTLVANPFEAARAAFGEVLLLPAFPVGLVGLASVLGLWRSAALRHPTALQALLLSGALTFLATVVLFPVASRWGTYQHASGPFLVALTATAALGSDALLARISRWRGWSRTNVVLGPAALVVVGLAMGVLQVTLLASQSDARRLRYESIGRSLAEVAARTGPRAPGTLITDHPMWLSTVTGRPAIALPDEAPAAVMALGDRFGTDWLVVVDDRGRYPAALLEGPGSACLAAAPTRLGDAERPAWLFRFSDRCGA